MRRTILVILSLLLLTYLAGVGFQEYHFQTTLKYELTLHQEQLLKWITTVESSRREVRSWGLFTTARTKDAGPILNIERPLATELVTKLRSKTWIDLETTVDLSTPDLTWMENLKDHDFWEAWTATHQAKFDELLSGEISPFVYFRSVSISSMQNLLPFGKLRLLKGLSEKKPLPALEEVRSLAKLCHSTEDMYGVMIAGFLLDAERETYLKAVERGLVKSEEWKPVPQDGGRLVQDLALASDDYLSAAVPADLFERAFPKGELPPTVCASLREATGKVAIVHERVRSPLPLERRYSEGLDRMRAIALDPNTRCRSKDIRAYWERDGKFDTRIFIENERRANDRNIPFFRTVEATKVLVYGVSSRLPATLGTHEKK